MKTTFKGYQEDTGMMVYEFSNPYGGEPMIRNIRPIFKDDGSIDKEGMKERVKQHAMATDNKMKIAMAKIPTAKELGLSMYTPSKTENVVENDTPDKIVEETQVTTETEDSLFNEAKVIQEAAPETRTKKTKTKGTKKA